MRHPTQQLESPPAKLSSNTPPNVRLMSKASQSSFRKARPRLAAPPSHAPGSLFLSCLQSAQALRTSRGCRSQVVSKRPADDIKVTFCAGKNGCSVARAVAFCVDHEDHLLPAEPQARVMPQPVLQQRSSACNSAQQQQ
jgi:hypothetical protein